MADLSLTPSEVESLCDLLLETAQTMDDDGREGAFDASPLRGIWDKARKLRAHNRHGTKNQA
jgi:hypothetical protein